MIDLMFPKQCLVCDKIGDYLCIKCRKKLLPHPEICPYCHKFSENYQTCLDCRCLKENSLEGIMIPFCYGNEIKKLILKLKYYHKTSVADFLIDRLYLVFLTNSILQRQLIIKNTKLLVGFVPSHRRRHYFVKGYNQSQLLAQKFAKKYDYSFVVMAKKFKHTKSQASLSRQDRLSNLKKTYVLNNELNLKGDEILLLIDDITTTGATLNELGKTIKLKYPKLKIWGMVVGRHAG